MRRLVERPGLVFALVFAWKTVLLIFTAQPVPANDAFFYDGAVVNFLLHGKYINPSLALVLPISGNEVFCAYPPLYQLALLGWMSVFGTSALSAMWLHLVLFGVYELIVLAIFQRLKTPGVCVNLAGLFLFSITFHDRPDSLAHVLGALAIYGWIRQRSGEPVAQPGAPWVWLAALSLLLTFCTSLQIGAVYLSWIALLTLAATWLKWNKFPWAPALVFIAAMVSLIVLVRFGHPRLWEGFQEHARITPSIGHWRLPGAAELLKVVRTAPGILLTGGLLALLAARGKICEERLSKSSHAVMAVTATATAFALIAACLVLVTANTVSIANYLQPVIVGSLLAALRQGFGDAKLGQRHVAAFLAAALLVAVRATGMTTWGLACNSDVGYRAAMRFVRGELETTAPRSAVVFSSAFLYEAARHPELRWIHSDWPGTTDFSSSTWEREALVTLKPAKLIITQFDYYRRYEAVLAGLKTQPQLVNVKMENKANVPAPDSIKSLQKVVQHISWAPVVVEFTWH